LSIAGHRRWRQIRQSRTAQPALRLGYTGSMSEALLFIGCLLLLAAAWLAWRVAALGRKLDELPAGMAQGLEEKHRHMLHDLHQGLADQGERIGKAQTEAAERLRGVVGEELRQTRESVHALKLALSESLGQSREAMVQQLAATTEQLSAKIDQRLEQISGRVGERLDEGFKKTNETFVNVMQRLATIDEAQKKIDGLAVNVVSLQELLDGDKRSRGAFGEVQLEALVRNMLSPDAYQFQFTLSNKARVDCVLKLPQPTGMVAVDSKFPLNNYRLMLDPKASEVERAVAQKQFRQDLKKHVDDISGKYIIPGETSEGAVMFVPAEAVFAEIHAYHSEVVDYAMGKRVWIVSPTTLMAVLNMARAVLKDVETRKQIHVIKDALAKLAKDFNLFDDRMKKLADHIRLAGKDVEEIHVSSRKITQRFEQIESVQLEERAAADNVVRLADTSQKRDA
jgi:DNA recombination protein RmuC